MKLYMPKHFSPVLACTTSYILLATNHILKGADHVMWKRKWFSELKPEINNLNYEIFCRQHYEKYKIHNQIWKTNDQQKGKIEHAWNMLTPKGKTGKNKNGNVKL